MKSEGARVITSYSSYILDAQGQLALLLVVGFGHKSNPFKLLWFSLLPARIRKIHSKMKALEWSKQIFHCKSLQIFADALQGQFTLRLRLVLLEIQTHSSFYGCLCYLKE